MKRHPFGEYEISSTAGEKVRAFVPPRIHPVPELRIPAGIQATVDQALLSLGRLDGAAGTMPDIDLLLYTFVRKEAVLSSQIEGTQSTLDDLLAHEIDEAPGVPLEDVREVSRYVLAMGHGMRRLAEGFPLVNRLLREMHQILLASGRGAEKQPGEFRSTQNWIGGTRPGNASFVPPPPHRLGECLADFERFLQEPVNPILKAALAHVQFETLHPFLDGNGRVGRLLITLSLINDRVLKRPLLYPSLYFKEHRQDYYAQLNAVRETGDYEQWIEFFAEAIRHSADVAIETGVRISEVFREDRELLRKQGRMAGTLLMVQEALQAKPMANIAMLTSATGLTTPTVTAALRELVRLGVARETTGRARGRVFAYKRYLDALSGADVR